MTLPTLCSCLVLHDDCAFLDSAVRSVIEAGPVFAFVSRLVWHGDPGGWEAAADVARETGAEVILGDWPSESEHRRFALGHVAEKGFTHALIPDGDEKAEPGLLRTLVTIAEHELADRVYVHWDTYWKTSEYVIRPREGFTPCILLDLRVARHVHIREFAGGRPLLLSPEHGLIHHYSYAGTNERIRRKITTWSHREEVVPGWFDDVWLAWDDDKLMRNLHPTHPGAYGFAERVRRLRAETQEARGEGQELRAESQELRADGQEARGEGQQALASDVQTSACATSPAFAGSGKPAQVGFVLQPDDSSSVPQGATGARGRVSVVIPLHGGAADLRGCLESLVACDDLVADVVVVDNASPDGAAEVAEAFAWPDMDGAPKLRLVRMGSNAGFAAACNRGAAETAGEIILFLNSDTVVPRIGLQRLLEALDRSGSIAAAGPYTNNAGHFQRIAPTYTSLATLELFAEDFADRTAEDVDTDMLVGFCLAGRRRVWDEVGGFDEAFGLGTFEDNDLCYRMRRAGYRLVIAARSFVHHHGSKTIERLRAERQEARTERQEARGEGQEASGERQGAPFDIGTLLRQNEALYRRKWARDLEMGYASALPGLTGQRIVFHEERHPDKMMHRMRGLARRADISLCMIVRDEERVLGECLASAAPFFREMVVVDTGSIDRTPEIAEQAGAKVFRMEWPDSFAEARNESLRHAQGRWVFWMDADDTLPWSSGEALIDAVVAAPPDVSAFVVPVQFVEERGADGRVTGTRVDHVKLFRNLPGVRFEGRIHEQVLGSLRKLRPDGRVARCPAVVLHSGYDTSPEGQARKRSRDLRLLRLDYRDRPAHPFVHFNIGMTYHYLGDHRRAARWLRRCLTLSKPDESPVRKAYALLGVSVRETTGAEEAVKVFDVGLAAVGDDPELHFQAGATLTALATEPSGREPDAELLARAKEHYEQCLRTDASDHFSSVDVGILGYKTMHNIGSVCMLMGDYRSARDWWHKAIQDAPSFLPSAFALFDAALDTGDTVTARRMLDAVRAAEGDGGSLLGMQVKLADAVGGDANGDELLARAVASNPEATGPRLLLARRLLNTGREAAALPHLRALDACGIAEASYFLGVSASRRGDYGAALKWMSRALELDPEHAETTRQIDALHEAMAQAGGAAPDAST